MSKNTTIIINRNPDSDIPEEYLRKVLGECNSCGGYAVQTKDGGLVSDTMDTGVQLDAVQELLKGYASDRVLLVFSKLEKVKDEFLQPFNLMSPDGETPLLSFALEGDFPSLAEAGITPEANFAKKVLLPNLNKFLKYSDGDFDKFMAELKDDTFTDSIMARIGDRGQFAFLPPMGDAIWLGKNKLSSFFPWGAVSNTLGYKEEAPKKPEEVKTEKKTGWWGKGNSNKPKLTISDKPAAEPAPAPKPEGLPPEEEHVIKDPGPGVVEPAPQDTTKPPEGEWKEVPRGLSKKDRKAFIRRVTGCGNALPNGWEQPDFKYYSINYPSAAKDIQALQQKYAKDEPKDMRQPAPKPVNGNGNKQPTSGREVVTEANAMVLTADEKSAAETTLLKIMDRKGNEIPSPEAIQKQEEKYPVFTGQFGVTSDQVDSWSPRDIETFAKENPKAFFHMFLEVRRDRIEARKALKAATPAPEVKEEPKVQEPEKKVVNSGWGSWGKKK